MRFRLDDIRVWGHFESRFRDFQVKGEPLVCPIDKGIVSVDKVV